MAKVNVTAASPQALLGLIRSTAVANGWTGISAPTSFGTGAIILSNNATSQSLYLRLERTTTAESITCQVSGTYQPGVALASQTGITAKAYLSVDRFGSMPAEIFVNNNRIIVVLKIKNSWTEMSYFGKLLTFTNNATYPDAYFAAGGHNGIEEFDTPSIRNTHMAAGGNAVLKRRGVATSTTVNNFARRSVPANWDATVRADAYVFPQRSLYEFDQNRPPYRDCNESAISLMASLKPYANGRFPVFQALVFVVSLKEYAGALDGVYFVPHNNITSGTVLIGGNTYYIYRHGLKFSRPDSLFAIRDT